LLRPAISPLDMKVAEFDYHLPPELIAQRPKEKRDESRLLILDRKSKKFHETVFYKITDYLNPGDVLIFNDTRVIPARIYPTFPNGKRGEVLLLRRKELNLWEVLTRPAKRFKPGVRVRIEDCEMEITERKESGVRHLRFLNISDREAIEKYGKIALPPYIKEELKDPERYQTIFAKKDGGVASPTASLHFTPELINRIRKKGVEIGFITLHPSLGTFRPIKTETVEEHKMYDEDFEIDVITAEMINRAKKEKRRIIACGTTVVRALEGIAMNSQVRPYSGSTDIFIYPGYKFKIVDCLITNFHLPKSTLLLLLCAFADKELIFSAYRYAIEKRFFFYSFGDAMFIV